MRNTAFLSPDQKKVVAIPTITNTTCKSVKIIGIACAIILSFLLPALSGSTAWADVGPSCGPNHYYDYPVCNYNRLNLSANECHDFCNNSDYCQLYQDGQRTVFGGVWREEVFTVRDVTIQCTDSCTTLKEQCDINNQECLAKFLPQDPDCSQLTDEEDISYCNSSCTNTILTSECGRNCMREWMRNNCESLYCSYLCYDSYCATIPMNYNTKWSIFGLLMAMLAASSLIILVVMHRKNNTQTEGKNS